MITIDQQPTSYLKLKPGDVNSLVFGVSSDLTSGTIPNCDITKSYYQRGFEGEPFTESQFTGSVRTYPEGNVRITSDEGTITHTTRSDYLDEFFTEHRIACGGITDSGISQGFRARILDSLLGLDIKISKSTTSASFVPVTVEEVTGKFPPFTSEDLFSSNLLMRISGTKNGANFEYSIEFVVGETVVHSITDLSTPVSSYSYQKNTFYREEGSINLYMNQVTHIGTRGQLESDCLGSDVTIEYQWLKNGAPLTGETTETLQFNPFEVEDVGSYQCKANDGSEWVYSNPSIVELDSSATGNGYGQTGDYGQLPYKGEVQPSPLAPQLRVRELLLEQYREEYQNG